MAKIVKKTSQEQNIAVKIIAVIIISIIASIVGFLWWRLYLNNQRQSTAKIIYPVENEKSEAKVIPPDVKKTIQPASSSATFRVPILMYHYIEYVQDKKDTIRQSLDTTPATLIAQIQTLKNAGYTFMTASELGNVLDGKEQLPTNPILLTFDDGHRDFYTDAFPILKQYNVKATSYVISGFLGGTDFMTPQQVQDIASSGLVEVGAHTVHHIALRGKPLVQVQFEVNNSKTTLEQLTHKPVVSFAYPYGSFDNQAIQVLKDAGFETALSTVPGIEVSQQNRYFLYRLRPGARSGQVLLNWLNQSRFTP